MIRKLFLNFLAFIFGCGILLCTLIVLEIIYIPLYKKYFHITITENPPTTIYNEMKQKKLNPGVNGSATIKKGTYPPITYTYSIDKKGRRNTYISPEKEKNINALFVGCSFTFGTGVNDDETFPSQFAIKNPQCNVYNYGMPGGSPQEIYLLSLSPEFIDDLDKKPTLVIYTFISNHLKRLVGSWSIIGRWGKYLPCMEMNDGELYNVGTFATVHPYTCLFSKMLYKSYLLSTLFDLTKVDIPLTFKEKDFELLNQILIKTFENLYIQFPKVHLIFLFFPGSSEVVPELYDYISNQNKYIVVDFLKDRNKQEILKELEKRNEHKFPDGHPKPIIYKYLAEWLTEELQNRNLLP